MGQEKEVQERAQRAKQAMQKRSSGYKGQKRDHKQTAIIIAIVSVFVGILLVAFSPSKGSTSPVNDAGLIDHVNRNAKTWQAGSVSMFDGWVAKDVRELGPISWRDYDAQWHLCPPPEEEMAPASFDSREKWPQCFPDFIFETGNCSGSWATAPASTVAKRFCINEPEKYPYLTLSAQSSLSCDLSNNGCSGGGMDTVWSHLESDGLVSETCFPTKGWDVECGDACEDEEPMRISAKCAVQGVDVIKREIATNGPVVAQMYLSDEVLVYKSGIFLPTPTSVTFTAKGRDRQKKTVLVALLGWGADGDQEYWLVENAWGKDWGEGGFGRIGFSTSGEEEDKANQVVVTDVVFVGFPSNHKLGPGGSPEEFDDINYEEDLDDTDAEGEEDLFSDLDLDEEA